MRVLLVCAGGMSTSMLMKKMMKYAEEHDFPLDIAAHGAFEQGNAEDWDVVLLGPQVAYKKDAIQAACGNVPVDVIPMLNYGRQNCEAIFEQIHGLLGEK